MAKNAISVFVDGQHSGLISRSELEGDTFLFTYDPACPNSCAVSLTMPVAPDQYDSVGLIHPIFEMNLPEGHLRQKLELMFSKAIPNFDSLSLLEIVGKSQIGRLRYTAKGLTLEDVPAESVDRLLAYKGSEDLFGDLMDRFATHSGISGVQPKVLIRDKAQALDRITNKGATHIVKSFSPTEYPELAANEFFSMRAAHFAGLPAPHVDLSANRSMLVVERFDRDETGRYMGFEDFCVLSGMRASGRYHSSYEDLAAKVLIYVSPESTPAAMEQLFGMIALCCAIRNGDAHLKNFGVLYDEPGVNVRLAPVYDMVSTTPYQPSDVLALTMNGSKQFPSKKELVFFGRTACQLSNQKVESILVKVATGARRAIAEMQEYASLNPNFKTAADHFTKVFSKGVETLEVAVTVSTKKIPEPR